MSAPLSLLLIDDDELDRQSIVRALKRASIELNISQSATAADGLALAAAKQFDAILLDYRLPDMDGIEVLRQLRSGRFEGVAVIMLSRYEDDVVAEQCMEAGAQDFLLKDEVNGRRLTRAVRQAKQRYTMEQQLKSSHEELRVMAEHDPLTGLANRRGFEIALHAAIARSRRSETRLAVLLLDLDDFKIINDTVGHDAGDQVLIQTALRLQAAVRDGDFLGRLGGDEFIVLAVDMKHDEETSVLADRLIDVIGKPILINDSEHIVTASIGVALLGEDSDGSTDLLKHADIAMYRAKQGGRNQSHFYSEQLNSMAHYRATMRQDMRKALARGEFRIYYQALVKASDQTLMGMEALLRWHHPRLGILAPGEFLEIAEETGLIVNIGNWVLQSACKQLVEWRSRLPENYSHLVLAVNLSAAQMRDKGFLGMVEEALSDSQLTADSLELEITENALIEYPAGAAAMLSALAQQGVSVSLDDFGTGYSSLQHLKTFPVKVLKIDKGFVAAIGQDVNSDRLLVAMIRFARALELKIVAEGVETMEQATFCCESGCDLLQGFRYSTPVPAEQFEASFLRR